MIRQIRQANQGRKILHDWLGKGGKPVPIELAQSRADICRTCPRNYPGAWLWNLVTSFAISAQMELKNALRIQLNDEDKINVCELCGCHLKLKVHVPFEHIYRHTHDEHFTAFPDHCWMKRELNQLKKP